MDFRAHIRQLAQQRRVLEIGPSYNPIIPKSAGFDVVIFDHADAASLREKYGKYGIDVSPIEDVDFVGTDLKALSQMTPRFDLIVASHLVEHTTDLVDFLRNCRTLLAEDGLLALIVPDKRYSFDLLRPLTSAGGVIDAHLSGRNRHHGALFDHYANFVLNRDRMAWEPCKTYELTYLHGPAEASTVLNAAVASSDYVDAHEWVFTPSSFRLVLHDLVEAELVELREHFVHPSVGPEFLVVLSSGKGMATPARIDLLRRTAIEQLASSVSVVAALGEEVEVSPDDLKEQVGFLKAQLGILQAAFARSETVAESLQYDLDRLHGSLSWKLTGPLRRLRARLPGRRSTPS